MTNLFYTTICFILLTVSLHAQSNVFPSSGNVGIGVTNPVEKLDIAGVTYLRGAPTHSRFSEQLRLGRGDTNIRYHSIYTNHTGSSATNIIQFWVHTGNIDDLTEQLPVMLLNGAGNVGIGTESPGDWRLAVNGKIRAKEIKVETGWSDFVFEEDYDLPSLDEVERHIKEKGHLKDIPSAREVEENGVFLGEMDARLLQKIEELTLYIIQQDKQIRELKQENTKINDLEEKLEKLSSRL